MNKLPNFLHIKGVTLIEVLVAVVITSIGILGFASLQFLGLNSNQSAYSRSQATFIATDLAERMRANIEGLNEENAYATVTINSSTLNCSVPTNSCDERNNAGTVEAATVCDAQQRADHDIFVIGCGYASNEYANQSEKTNFLGDLLPNGNITITCNDSVPTPAVAPAPGDSDPCTDNSDHTIVVSWSETNEGADASGKLIMSAPTTKSVSYRVRL